MEAFWPHYWLFRDCGKTVSCSPPFLAYLFIHSFRPLLKISAQYHRRSGHRSGQVTLPPKIFLIAPWIQFVRYQYETFRKTYGHQCLQYVFFEFCFGDLRSGQFCDITVIKHCEMPKCLSFRKYDWEHANHIKIFLYWATLDDR